MNKRATTKKRQPPKPRKGASPAEIKAWIAVCQAQATPEEREDNQVPNLPRIGFEFNKRDYGRMRQLIDVLNSF